jgi:hypothetical protein
MADLSITVASVAKGSGASTAQGVAGATITAGQVVYLDSATSTYKLADANGAAALRSPVGIALHAALSGQPLQILTGGLITIGATLVAGTVYVLSGTAGAIAPAADVVTGWYLTIVGVPVSTTVLKVAFLESGLVA